VESVDVFLAADAFSCDPAADENSQTNWSNDLHDGKLINLIEWINPGPGDFHSLVSFD